MLKRYFYNIFSRKRGYIFNLIRKYMLKFNLYKFETYPASKLLLYKYSSFIDILYYKTVSNEDVESFITLIRNPICNIEELILFMKKASIKGFLWHGKDIDHNFFSIIDIEQCRCFLEMNNYKVDNRELCIIESENKDNYVPKNVKECVGAFIYLYFLTISPIDSPTYHLSEYYSEDPNQVSYYICSNTLHFLYDKTIGEISNEEIYKLLDILRDCNIENLINFFRNTKVIKGLLYKGNLFQIPPSATNMLLLLNYLNNGDLIGVFQERSSNINIEPLEWNINSVKGFVFQILKQYELCTGKKFLQFLHQQQIDKNSLSKKSLLELVTQYQEHYKEWILLDE